MEREGTKQKSKFNIKKKITSESLLSFSNSKCLLLNVKSDMKPTSMG